MPRQHRPRNLWKLFLPLVVLAVYLSGGCAGLRNDLERWVDRTFGQATQRERFGWESNLDKNILARWDTAHARALRLDSLRIEPPHLESFRVADTSLALSAHAFTLRLPAGRVLEVSAGGNTPLFGELYRLTAGEPTEMIAEWDSSATLSYASGVRSDSLRLVVQSAPFATQNFRLRLSTRPALLFPVAGGDERSIRSFWGDRRDGGRRRHEGNDIFAPRGTPLLAVTDGRVSRVRNGGLGGKTVWLRDADRPVSYYYAHLSEQLVESGQYVRRGDTLGLVGNSGNARTTPPHLHFGIYGRRGARDPFPFLLGPDDAPAEPRQPPGSVTAVPNRGNHYLRYAPASNPMTIIRKLENGAPLRELATTGRFHRVVTASGEVGYVNLD